MKKQLLAGVACGALALTGCGANNATSTSSGSASAASSAAADVTVKNCQQDVTFKRGASLLVNDGNLIAMTLEAGGHDQIKAVSNLDRHEKVLIKKYGQEVTSLKRVSASYPSLETVIATAPDVMVAGWGYGFSESSGLTPQALHDKGISSYILTESCRQADGKKRGFSDPWEAVRTDVSNLGKITGHEDKASATIADMNTRLDALHKAPKGDKPPTVFLFDSAKDSVLTSGAFGGPQGIIEAAGAKNAVGDVQDTWTRVGWEKIAASNPDVIAFVDYPAQKYAEKIAILKENPATKDLPAVKEGRFVNLPYASWTSGPLNIDAAENLRKSMEKFGVVPASDVPLTFDMSDTVDQS